MRASRRQALKLAIAASCIPFGAAMADEAWPQQAIKLIVPVAPGGVTDIYARDLALRLAAALGKAVIVENRSGANGQIGNSYVARANNDGHTLLLSYAGAMAMSPALFSKLPYDAVSDFEAVAEFARGGIYLLVTPDTPVTDLKSFVEWVKAQPKGVSYGTWGTGSPGYIFMEVLRKQRGLDVTQIQYRGAAPVIQAMLAGEINVGFADSYSALSMLQAKKLRAVVVGGKARAPQTPEVPAAAEQGFPWKVDSWIGLFAPKGTPKPIIERLSFEVNKILSDPEMIDRLAQRNFLAAPSNTPDDFRKVLRDDIQSWHDLVRIGGIPPQ